MIENALISVIYILFFGLVGITIIALALMIILVYLLSKQN